MESWMKSFPSSELNDAHGVERGVGQTNMQPNHEMGGHEASA